MLLFIRRERGKHLFDSFLKDYENLGMRNRGCTRKLRRRSGQDECAVPYTTRQAQTNGRVVGDCEKFDNNCEGSRWKFSRETT